MQNKIYLFISIFAVIISAFYTAGLLMPAGWNWSVFALPGLNLIQTAVLGLALILIFLRPLSSAVYTALSGFFNSLSRILGRMPMIARVILWIVVPFILLYLLRVNTFIYGDSQNLIGSIVSGEISSPFYNRIGMLMQLLARPFDLVQNTREAATQYLALISTLAGVVFIFFTWKTVRLVIKNSGAAVITFLAVITSGMIIIFAGYLEVYSIIIAWLSVFIYYAVRYLQGKGRTSALIFLFIVGIFWHIWFIAFFPSLLFVLNRKYKLLNARLLLAFGIIFVIAVYFIGQFVHRGEFPLTIPFLPSNQTNYWLFSPAHLLDMANQIIVVGPLLIIFAFIMALLHTGKDLGNPQRFLLWAGLPALAITFMIDPHLGAARDWDLLSIFAAPLIILGAIFFQTKSNTKLKYLLVAILLFNILHTGSILAVNKNQEYAVDRIVNLTFDDPHYQTAYHDGIRNRPFAVILSNVYHRHDDAIRFMKRRINPEFIDVLSMGEFYFNMEDYKNAIPYYKSLYDQGLLTTLHKFCYGKSQLMARHPDVAIQILKPITRDSTFFDLYFNIGVSYLLTWRPDTGVIYLDSGLAISDDPVEDLHTCLEIARSSGSPYLTAHFQKKLLYLFPDSLQVKNKLVDLYRKAGMPDSANYYMNHRIINAP